MDSESNIKYHNLDDYIYKPKDTDYFSNDIGPDGSPIEGAQPDSIKLASFELTNGNKIEFVGVKDIDGGDEIGVIEIGGGPRESSPSFPPTTRMTVSEMFLKLAPKDTPIPDLIISSDKGIDKKKYKTTEYIAEPITIDLDEIGIKSVETDSHYCEGGYNSFKHDFVIQHQ